MQIATTESMCDLMKMKEWVRKEWRAKTWMKRDVENSWKELGKRDRYSVTQTPRRENRRKK